MKDREDFARLLSETALILLREQDDWHSVAYQGEYFGDQTSTRAESSFQRIAVKERTKFNSENSYTGLIRDSSSASSKPTLAVVSIVAAVRGRSSGLSAGNVRSVSSTRECLQGLAADAMVDGGDGVLGVEVLWTPDSPALTLGEKDVVEDYPELLKL